MSDKTSISSDEEAKNLLDEAAQEERAGNKDEAEFLREAAKNSKGEKNSSSGGEKK